MKLKDILSISGESGLFKFIAQGKNSIIVEHFETKKRSSAHGTAKVSSLDDIAIFTDEEDMPLGKVFDLIFEKENGGQAIDHKSTSGDLKKYFESILPDYDRDRVYVSDIKKLLNWYNTLQSMDLLEPDDEVPDEEVSEEKSESKDQGETDQPEESPKD